MRIPGNVLIFALDERWRKYRSELKACKQEFSEEAVHDLRVASRRLLALLDVLRSLDTHPRVQKMRRTLKDQLDALDELRDTQVMLVEVSEAVDLPGLKAFEEYLLKREKKLLGQARKDIRELQISEIKQRLEKCRTSLQEYVPEKDFEARLLSVVDQAYGRAMQAFGQIEASQPASIHRFRIAFKKFRYTVEIAHPILKNYPEAHLKQMHDYQGRMGDVQDAEVLLGALTAFARKMEARSLSALAREPIQNQHTEMIAKFMDGKEEIHLFWRAAPEAKLPWEKNHEPVHHPSRHRSRGGNARIRKRQSASIDRPGEKENAKDRPGIEVIESRS